MTGEVPNQEPNEAIPAQPEAIEKPESISVEALPEWLGLVETEQMRQTANLFIESIAAGNDEQALELVIRYRQLGEEIVNEKQGDDYPLAQIGLIIQLGLLKQKIGREEEYIQELEDAQDYAYNLGFDDVGSSLNPEVSRYYEKMHDEAVARVKQSNEASGGLNLSTEEETHKEASAE